MSLSKQFTLVFVAFFITVIICAFFFYKMTKDLERDNAVINLAGRQRMLTQKYFKEYINELIPLQIRHNTLKAAEIATLQIVEDRKQYTKSIIDKLERDGVVEVHPNSEYINIDGGIPLPATFVQEVSNKIKEKGVYSYSLLSRWNINREKGLNTDFENEAFDYLLEKKGTIFSRFIVQNGFYTLRYATADVAYASACVSCHNNHEDCIKKDFKIGDLMGILVVNIPIGSVSAETIAFFGTSNDQGYIKDTFIKTKNVFDTTLKALISGGNAPLEIDMREFTMLSPTKEPAIKSKLEEVRKLWYSVQDNLKKLTVTTPSSTEYIVAYKTAYDNNNRILVAMNEAVVLFHAASNRKVALFFWWAIGGFFGVAFLVIGFCWTFLIYRRILQPIKKLSSSAKLISEGKLNQEIEVKSRDEVGMLANNFNDMLSNLRESRAQIEKSNWLKTGQAELYERMHGEHDITSLSRNTITFLAEYLNAQVGVIYMTKNHNTLKIVGSYAYTKPYDRPDTFKFGEGLAGQVAQERKAILATDIPEDYIKIDTGWSKAIPRNILIVPLIFKETVTGVIELGSHNKFTDLQLEFINIVVKNIAMVSDSTLTHLRTEKLEHLVYCK